MLTRYCELVDTSGNIPCGYRTHILFGLLLRYRCLQGVGGCRCVCVGTHFPILPRPHLCLGQCAEYMVHLSAGY